MSKMVQFGGFIGSLLSAVKNLLNITDPFMTPFFESMKEKRYPKPGQNSEDYLIDVGVNALCKEVKKCSGITLTHNETKDIMNVINSLENRGILSKGTSKKIRFLLLNFSIILDL